MNTHLGIDELLQRYRRAELNPHTHLKSLRDLAAAQSEYNAWIYLLDDRELEAQLQFLEGQSPDSLPLFGVPFAIKDNIDLAGVPTSAACREFSYVPKESAAIVRTLLDAGAIPLGKTNMDQFATGLVGTRSPYGEAKNCFNPDYISGGSSSGSALATALGEVCFALGTDTAGSGRVPAVLNNIIGLKPTKGLLSTRGVVPACRSLDCVSIFALTPDDAAKVFEVAATFDAQDAFARKNIFANRERFFRSSAATPFHFGIVQAPDFDGNAETEALYKHALHTLQTLGGVAVAIDFSPFLECAKLLYEGPWVAERWLATEEVKEQSMLPVIRDIIKNGNSALASDAFSAEYRRLYLKRLCDQQIENLAFVLTPTSPSFYTREQIRKEPIRLNSKMGTYTNFMNLLDYAAVATPLGFTECGVPWGVTLFGHAFRDIALLNFAARLRDALDLPLGNSDKKFSAPAKSGISEIPERIDVVVCGAHLQGQPLNWQLTERGGTLVRATHSSDKYTLYALADGKRPAMMRDEENGKAIEVEVWSVPAREFGSFVAAIPPPLGIGKVELDDGSWVSGFICEASGLQGATNITQFGGWRAWLASSA